MVPLATCLLTLSVFVFHIYRRLNWRVLKVLHKPETKKKFVLPLVLNKLFIIELFIKKKKKKKKKDQESKESKGST
jgi:hypothetical protein